MKIGRARMLPMLLIIDSLYMGINPIKTAVFSFKHTYSYMYDQRFVSMD